ncbi:glycosyltransferase [Oryzibacter oryziterrae]|uniref:glycosyltransferase n=1 Tax=Oryzibacter oryziterrae TaxID=2766474 RepID=UPI001F20EC66|nr:glycosyltransferase [Oryzibacter oryziterrae]
MSAAENKRKHVVLVRRGVGFPNGMATADRIRRIGAALASVGARVTLLTVGTTEAPNRVVNKDVRGHFEGVDYEYTSGRTVRPTSAIVRRFVDAWSHCLTAWRILTLNKATEYPAVFLGYDLSGPTALNYLATAAAWLRGIPVYIEVNERPWALMENKKWFSRLSPLTGTDGAVVISDLLAKWAREDTAHRREGYKILQIPILASGEEFKDITPEPPKNYVVFSGAIAYASTMRFIIEAMEKVWPTHPDCKLMLTGYREGHPEWKALVDWIAAKGLQQNVTLLGYLDRKDLLQLYCEAKALLIPLFEDVQSAARFPTKIGEYLFSSRPIVTTNVADVTRYFRDGETAYIAESVTLDAYGAAIRRALSDEASADVGENGRRVAKDNFDVSLYGKALNDFF